MIWVLILLVRILDISYWELVIIFWGMNFFQQIRYAKIAHFLLWRWPVCARPNSFFTIFWFGDKWGRNRFSRDRFELISCKIFFLFNKLTSLNFPLESKICSWYWGLIRSRYGAYFLRFVTLILLLLNTNINLICDKKRRSLDSLLSCWCSTWLIFW